MKFRNQLIMFDFQRNFNYISFIQLQYISFLSFLSRMTINWIEYWSIWTAITSENYVFFSRVHLHSWFATVLLNFLGVSHSLPKLMHFPLLPVSYLQAYSSQYYINISIKLNWIENLLIYLILILFCQFIYSKNSVKIHKYLLTCLCPTPPPHQHPPLTRSNELTFIIGVNGGWGNSFEFI